MSDSRFYQQGYSAWEKHGARLWDNPHKEGTDAHSEWLDGWYQARKDRWVRRIRKTCQRDNVKGIRVVDSDDDRVCDACSERDGKFFSCEEAIQDPPIPHENCSNDRCRCVYVAEHGDDSLLNELLDL